MRRTDIVLPLDVIARPKDRAIQYAAWSRIIAGVCVYWMPAFAGMTSNIERTAP
jgi:hypothetical protein